MLARGHKTHLVAAITNSCMLMVTPGLAARQNQTLETELAIVDKSESVGWMVTMLVLQQAGQAQVIVLTVSAGDHLGLIEFCTRLDKHHGVRKRKRSPTFEACIAGSLLYL